MKVFMLFFLLAISYLGNAQEYCFKNVQVISILDKPETALKDVFIKDGKIRYVAAPGERTIESNINVIDGDGKFLCPGISEMHAHIPVPENGNLDYLKETLFLYLSNGITVIRGMLGNPFHLELKDLVESGEILGPRIYTSSPSINGNSVPDVETAIAKVSQYAQDGYDFLKMHPGLKLEVFNQIVKTANEVGIPFAGHVSTQVGVSRAIEARYATIDHLDGYLEGLVTEVVNPDENGFFGYNFTNLADPAGIEALADLTKNNNVWIVPTQSLFTRWFSPEDPALMMQAKEISYMPSKTRYNWLTNKMNLIQNDTYNRSDYDKFLKIRKQILKGLFDANVELLLGSDAPQVMNVPGFSIQHEMQAMSDAGIPTHAILKAGTINPAKFFHASNTFGSISEGLSADVILLNANPLIDIGNMKSIEGVMVKGKWLDRVELNNRLNTIAKKHAE